MIEIKPSRVQIWTETFRLDRGRSPRGRGSWAFHPDSQVDPCSDEVIWTPSMNYGEAVKYARQIAAERGWDFLVVLP